jgi:hypothetical protein
MINIVKLAFIIGKSTKPNHHVSWVNHRTNNGHVLWPGFTESTQALEDLAGRMGSLQSPWLVNGWW